MKKLALLLLFAAPAFAAPKEDRGLLKELQSTSKNESENEKRALQSEVLITKTETKAIEALQKILARKKGTKEEPSLLHRLAELYMRRARTGRFFDLHGDSQSISLFPTPPGRGLDWVRKANGVYADIIRRFPKYDEIDVIIFNSAFAFQQLGRIKEAENLYQTLISKHGKSPLVPDAALALGELAYDQRRFALAMDHLDLVRKYPESRVYVYSLYKKGWAQYNIKDSEGAVKTLLEVVKASPADPGGTGKAQQNLRKEALRDLVLFVSDTRTADEVYSLFKSFSTEEELGQAMHDLAKLHVLHGRHKQVSIASSTFLRNHPTHAFQVKLHILNLDAYENLRQRDDVLTTLRKTAELCEPGSRWFKAQTEETLKESCQENLASKSQEIANKWWDMWQKNKNNDAFSKLTENMMRIVLEKEDPVRPNIQLRFALAELLFQLRRWAEASEQYQITAGSLALKQKDKNAAFHEKDRTLLHNADYGALYAAEKAVETDAKSKMAVQRIPLGQQYLERHPKGDHAKDVQLRMAVLFYTQKDIANTLKHLEPLLAGPLNDLTKKAQDLHLDVLNHQKKYADLNKAVTKYLATEKDPQRLAKLKRIEMETGYASLQEKIADTPNAPAAFSEDLLTFAKKHPKTDLSSQALFQAAAISFQEGKGLSGAAALLEMLEQNPKHEKAQQSLLEASEAYAAAGEMGTAAKLLERLAALDSGKRLKHLEAAADFYLLENQTTKARALFQELLKAAPSAERPRIYTKLTETLKVAGDDNAVRKIKAQILDLQLEPYATEILIEQANNLLNEGKLPQAFEMARKIMSRSVPEAQRAPARLIQAKVLENEFSRQSVNSSKAERMTLVLEMKIEKLEKAQTAFLSASRMAQGGPVAVEALMGIDRCYQNLIDSFRQMRLPASMDESEQTSIRQEILQAIGPFEQKKKENQTEIRKLMALHAPPTTNWMQLGPDQSPLPALSLKDIPFQPYIVSSWSENGVSSRREVGRGSCDSKRPSFHGCLLAKKFDVSFKIAQDLSQDKKTAARGLHHLAQVSEAQGKHGKALWLLKRAEQLQPNHALIKYEKARMFAHFGSESEASAEFKQILAMSMSSTELRTLQAKFAFSEGDFKSVTSLFSGIPPMRQYDERVALLVAESLAQQGRPDESIRLLDPILAKVRNAEVLIQRARIEEVYKFAPVPAVQFYQQAEAASRDEGQREWLKKKIEYLKNNFKVGLHVTTGG